LSACLIEVVRNVRVWKDGQFVFVCRRHQFTEVCNHLLHSGSAESSTGGGKVSACLNVFLMI